MSPTQRAGHGRDPAREGAASGRPLIVSVSGDGGYNEVVAHPGRRHQGGDDRGPQPSATRYGFTPLGPTPRAGRGGPRTGRRDPRVRRGRPSGTRDDQLTGSAT